MLHLFCSPVLFLYTVVLSSDRVIHFLSRRAQVTSTTTPISFLTFLLAYLVIYQSEAWLLYLLGFIMIQGRVEIVEEFSEVLRCGCKGMLV